LERPLLEKTLERAKAQFDASTAFDFGHLRNKKPRKSTGCLLNFKNF